MYNIVFKLFNFGIIKIGSDSMNYIKCPNCHNQISANSTSCIYCGITKSIIEQEIRTKQVKEEKELASQIEGFYNNNKGKIIIIEVLILISIVIIYCVSYLPKIIEYSKIERINNNVEKCQSYGGTWNSESSICNTEFGVITIK